MKVLAALSVIIALVPIQALAQRNCEPADRMLRLLEANFREVPVESGISDTGSLITALATPDGDTWTIIVISRERHACLVAAGTNWDGQGEED